LKKVGRYKEFHILGAEKKKKKKKFYLAKQYITKK